MKSKRNNETGRAYKQRDSNDKRGHCANIDCTIKTRDNTTIVQYAIGRFTKSYGTCVKVQLLCFTMRCFVRLKKGVLRTQILKTTQVEKQVSTSDRICYNTRNKNLARLARSVVQKF